MASNQGKRPSQRAQASRQPAISIQQSAVSRTKPSQANPKPQITPRRRESQRKPKWPVSVVTRDGKTTIRQFQGRRFVRLGDFRGKKVAWVEFYTCGAEYSSISVRFQDRTVVYFRIDPMFSIKPYYCRLKAGDLETVKEWPRMRMEKR